MNYDTAAARYERLSGDREVYLTRARDAARLTIPTLVPPAGHSSATVYSSPAQSLGARGLNNLASKLLLTFMPPNTPFFRYQIDDFTVEKLAQDPTKRAVVDEGLNRVERAIQGEVEAIGLRSPTFQALKQLLVAGNCVFYVPRSGRPRTYRLDSYVCRRDPLGNILEVILKDVVSKDTLTADELAMLDDPTSSGDGSTPQPIGKSNNTVDVYTRYYLEGNKYHLYQEINGKVVPHSTGSYNTDEGPILALRWTVIDGEDYGRGYVEEYLGDLETLEGITLAIKDGAAASARLLLMVRPNGTTRIKDVAKAPNGAIVQGDANDVTALQVQKQGDFAVAERVAVTVTERLQFAFLMNTAIQRNAERVTAEEVRYVAGELEDALGGVYSVLSQDFQLPLVKRLIANMTRQGRLPKLPKEQVRPTIVTGLEALGRGHDLTKYQQFFQVLAPLGPEAIGQFINVADYIKRVGTAVGIDMDGLVKSPEQMQQEQRAAQQAQMQQTLTETAGRMAERATPETVKAMANQTNG